MIGRLSQCSHVGRPRGIKKFAVNKLRSATPVRLTLLSTVEGVATLVWTAAYLWKAVFLQYYRLRSLTGLLLRCADGGLK